MISSRLLYESDFVEENSNRGELMKSRILALILANKRMLLVIPIVSVCVLFALSDQENKLLKGTIIGLGGVIVLIVIINTIPQFASVFERFQREGNNRKN